MKIETTKKLKFKSPSSKKELRIVKNINNEQLKYIKILLIINNILLLSLILKAYIL